MSADSVETSTGKGHDSSTHDSNAEHVWAYGVNCDHTELKTFYALLSSNLDPDLATDNRDATTSGNCDEKPCVSVSDVFYGK